MLLVVDANVLIDYANAERGVLALAARHLGPPLHRALALKPDDSRSALLLGQTLLAQGDVKAGTVQLEKALRLDPENTTAQYQLAVAYQKQGRKAEARKLFDRFRQSKAKQREEESVQVQLMRIIENKSSKTP